MNETSSLLFDFELISPKSNFIDLNVQLRNNDTFALISRYSDSKSNLFLGRQIAHRTWHIQGECTDMGKRFRTYKICFRHG